MGKIFGKKFAAMYLATCLLAASCCIPFLRPQRVDGAATVTIGSLVGYALTAMGAVNILTNGGVARVAGSVYDAIRTKISDYFGTEIYTDSNGNYVFSGTATQGLYDALSSLNNYDARVVSDFFDNPQVTKTVYWHPRASAWFAETTFTDFLFEAGLNTNAVSGSTYPIYRVVCYVYNLSNVAYMSKGQNGYFYFFDSLGSQIQVNYRFYSYFYNTSSGEFYNFSSSSSSSHYIASSTVTYMSFPDTRYYSTKSLIIGQDSANGLAYYNNNSGIIVNNQFNEIPPVSSTVIENNDWDNIYNSYVTNINNQKDVYYSDSSGTDVSALRRIMKLYGDEISQAIEEGASDISDRVNYLNNWMSLIYDRVSMIYDFISNGGSGSGSSSGSSSIDYTSILSAIRTDTGNIDTRLINIYAYLDTIVSAINRVNTGVSIDGSPNITIDHIFDDIMSISVDGITGYISKGQVFTSVAKNVSPLVFFEGMGDILEGLSSPPPSGYAPSWTIPFKVRNASVGLDIDEEIEIDLSGFSSVHDILIAFECLLFILFLMFFTIHMLKDVLYIFS